MQIIQKRRAFMAGAAAACFLRTATQARAEPPPETTTVRLPVFAKVSDCQSPMYAAGDLLRAEGFTDIQFVASGTGPDSSDWIGRGEIDFDWNYPLAHVLNIDKGTPIKVLTGLHVGCLELIANDRVDGVPDLKGKRVGVDGSAIGYLLINVITAYVGLDPAKDFETLATPDAVQSLADDKIDAFLGQPPQPQVARERKLGHVILSIAIDKPWSQYFCCMLASTSDYAEHYPIATKRVTRALLKAVDLCITNPEAVAKGAVDTGYASRYDYTLQAIRSDIRYDKWREYDPEDSMRFYALRMQETKAISISPREVIARGTDWRFLNELRRELKT
ncbi:ABC transporter substrate-binding protein [Rhizobium sp. 768_B6_N1_8]|jgi:NitT/TauT family transport system substrate-binding protein|uniref:ABC transporter substrate-binding protein n=1 Tax=unclassified Rhizobium TaxID=2613769 RepID=UPI003F2664A8